jgi:hypothetical protein
VGFSIVQEIPGFPPTNSLFDAMNDAVASPRSLAIFAPAMPIIACSPARKWLTQVDRH